MIEPCLIFRGDAYLHLREEGATRPLCGAARTRQGLQPDDKRRKAWPTCPHCDTMKCERLEATQKGGGAA